jgi:hypothetical protein
MGRMGWDVCKGRMEEFIAIVSDYYPTYMLRRTISAMLISRLSTPV